MSWGQKNKYRNKKTIIDGIKFASAKEAMRYCELKQLEKVGVIQSLRLQPRYLLQEKYTINGRTERSISYVADFEYWDNEKQKLVVEDVKSPATKTQVYKIKKKLFEKKYGIEITEI